MSFFEPLFTLDFWFDAYPAPLSVFWERLLFAFFGGLLIIGALARIVMNHKKIEKHAADIVARVAGMFVNMGIFGVVLFFFAYQRIPTLGSRFWFLLWGIGLIVWIVYIVRYSIREVPKRRTLETECQKIKKYLPTGKKKKKKKRR